MITLEQIAEQLRSCQRNWDWTKHGGLVDVLAEAVWEIVYPELARLQAELAKQHKYSMKHGGNGRGSAWFVDCSCGWGDCFRAENFGSSDAHARAHSLHDAHVALLLNGPLP